MVSEERQGPAGIGAGEGGPGPARSTRDRVIDALMELAAERAWDDFGMVDVAERAGVSLAEFRDAFPSKGAVLAGFTKRIDRIVLEGTSKALADESPRERLFDVLMRRLDALAPYRLALQGIAEWVRREPMAALALNGVLVNSMRFMLAAAGIEAEGPAGALKLQGLVVAWARVLDVWYDEDDPSLSRTMAVLDRELTRGETLVARIDDLDRLVSPLRLLGRAFVDASRRRRRRGGRSRFRPAAGDDYDTDAAI